jgi:outer membrane murein-binding lipoprotein Lpp
MRRIALLVSAAVLGVLPVAGCASDSPQAAVCDSLTAVQNSAQHVRETNVAENGLNQLRTNLIQLRTDVQQLIHNAKTQWAPQAQAIQASLDQVGSAVNAAKSAPSAAAFDAVRQALATLENSVKALGDAMRSTC